MVGENQDDVIGIAYLKDLVTISQEHPEQESVAAVTSVMRPTTFVPESKPVDELLREMQQLRIHLAIVIDEYGGTAGLVTIGMAHVRPEPGEHFQWTDSDGR